MKIIWINNEALVDVLEEQGIEMICNEDMQIVVSDEDAARIPAIVAEFAPAAEGDYGIENVISSLYDLAELINNAEDYPIAEVNAAIEANGWTDTSDLSDYDVCTDGTDSLVLDENTAEAKVISGRRQ